MEIISVEITSVLSLIHISLHAAIEGRAARVVCFNPEQHATNQISVRSVTDAVKYFEQTLSLIHI